MKPSEQIAILAETWRSNAPGNLTDSEQLFYLLENGRADGEDITRILRAVITYLDENIRHNK